MQVMSMMHEGFGRKFVAFLLMPRPQYWLARFYLSTSILLTTAFAWLLPVSAQRIALNEVGMEAWFLLAGVTAVAAVGLIDCVLNDILPARFHLRWADRRRHQIFMALAILLWWMVWMNGVHSESTLLVLRYAIDGSVCVVVAILDTAARYKQVMRVRAGDA